MVGGPCRSVAPSQRQQITNCVEHISETNTNTSCFHINIEVIIPFKRFSYLCFTCMSAFPLHVWTCIHCPKRLEEVVRSPETGVTDGYERHVKARKEPMTSASVFKTELSLQPLTLIILVERNKPMLHRLACIYHRYLTILWERIHRTPLHSLLGYS